MRYLRKKKIEQHIEQSSQIRHDIKKIEEALEPFFQGIYCPLTPDFQYTDERVRMILSGYRDPWGNPYELWITDHCLSGGCKDLEIQCTGPIIQIYSEGPAYCLGAVSEIDIEFCKEVTKKHRILDTHCVIKTENRAAVCVEYINNQQKIKAKAKAEAEAKRQRQKAEQQRQCEHNCTRYHLGSDDWFKCLEKCAI